MNIGAILALLLNSGVCDKLDFHAPSGATLRVVVCPLMQPAPAENAPADRAPATPAVKPDVQAMR